MRKNILNHNTYVIFFYVYAESYDCTKIVVINDCKSKCRDNHINEKPNTNVSVAYADC